MHDYYLEQSYGRLKVEGKAFDYVEVSRKRMDYNTGNRAALLTEALDKLLAREGKDALKEFDGVFFIYAGGRAQVARGSLYWPHKSNVDHNGKRWPYFICPEGGDRMANISVFCHEFGHMLGLPDLYSRPENPGMEGAGLWCAMASQAGAGRPQHFSAWCKEKLGWLRPAVIDPTVKQKLVLGPVEGSPKECFKVLVQPDGSEYLLLENRTQTGFDKSLPAGGLLIWRVVGNRPVLEESHGVGGPAGPGRFLTSVPFPSPANDSFTPFTTPSSRSQLGTGLPVYITNIRKRPDGKVTFHIGYEYQ
jgi:M6 family metalloprotease-like protein